MSVAFRVAQWVADGFLVGFVLYWLWVRYSRRRPPRGTADLAGARGASSPPSEDDDDSAAGMED